MYRRCMINNHKQKHKVICTECDSVTGISPWLISHGLASPESECLVLGQLTAQDMTRQSKPRRDNTKTRQDTTKTRHDKRTQDQTTHTRQHKITQHMTRHNTRENITQDQTELKTKL